MIHRTGCWAGSAAIPAGARDNARPRSSAAGTPTASPPTRGRRSKPPLEAAARSRPLGAIEAADVVGVVHEGGGDTGRPVYAAARTGGVSEPITVSSAAATRYMRSSASVGAMICRPTGNPSDSPHGTDTAGPP